MSVNQLIRAAENAEARFHSATSAALATTRELHDEFKRKSPWMVPLMGVAAGLVLSQTTPVWRNRVLTNVMPIFGGGLFALINPLLRRLK